MANQEHVEILTQGVEVWNKWRRDNFSIRPDLSRADLIGVSLPRANLSDSNLSGADLSEANLSQANLSMANLSESYLLKANFSGADLTAANLTGAYASRAYFSKTCLSKSNLKGAILWGAIFTEADLNEINLSETKLNETQFSNVDLSTVDGLEFVHHNGPSTIGLDTLTLSKGKISEVFLRGCGVTEDIINYLPALYTKPIEFYSCFISYSHADKAFARQLHDFLQGRGIRCWLDEHQLLPGHDIFEEVDRGIKLWDKVLLCASKDSLSSWWVDNEINRAFKKEQTIMKSRGKKVLALIPLDLDGFIFSGWDNGKAEQVKSRLAADFQGWQNDNDKLQQQFELVLKALRTDGGREAPPVSRL